MWRGSNSRTPPPACLGGVKRGFRAAHQDFGAAVVAPETDNAEIDAAIGGGAAREHERAFHLLGPGLGERARLVLIGATVQEDRDLPGADAGEHVARAQPREKALGRLRHQFVAGGMAEAFDDGVEAVEFEVQQRRAAALVGIGHQRLDPPHERQTVGQGGVGVVVDEEVEARLRALELADVGIERDVAGGLAGFVAQQAYGRPEGQHHAVLAAVPNLAAPTAEGADFGLKLLVEFCVVTPRPQNADRAAANVLAAIARQNFESRVAVLDAAGVVAHEDALVGVGEHAGVKAQLRLLALALGDVLMRADQPHDAAGLVEHRKAARENIEPMAVAMAQLDLDLVGLDLPGLQASNLLGDRLLYAGPRDLPPSAGTVGEIVALVAEHLLPARREIGPVVGDPPIIKALLGAAHGERQTLLALAQVRNGGVSRNDVFGHQQHERGRADQAGRAPDADALPATGEEHAFLRIALDFPAPQRLEHARQRVPVVLAHKGEQAEAADLGFAQADLGAKLRVGVPERAVKLDQREADFRRFERGSKDRVNRLAKAKGPAVGRA